MAMEVVGGALLSFFLSVLFDRLASRPVVDFIRGQKITSGLLKKLRIKLLSVNSVLDDAEEKQFNNPAVREWLDELKDALYAADDLLDVIKTEALRRKLEGDESESSSSRKSQVPISSSTWIDEFDKTMEPKIVEMLERLEFIVNEKDVLGLNEGVPNRRPQSRLSATSLVEEDGVYGRDEDKETTVKLLLSDDANGNKLSVIPVVGMGGIGKTTLAQLVYNDARVKQHFDLQAWVYVSEEFDVVRITQIIYGSVISQTCSITDLNLLQVKLKEALTGKKCFFVHDDVWNENYIHWDALRCSFESVAHGSKIIVTTRNQRVASMMGTVTTYHLNHISDEDCGLLFSKHAFGRINSAVHPTLEEISSGIIKKCKGLPLAAKSLGGLLRCKQSYEEWDEILKSEIWDLQDEYTILPALRLSYHHLPSHLKRCFSYCSIFPKGYKFGKSELVLLWMAEGFLSPQRKKMMEDVGVEYFDDLISRSFFQHSGDDQSLFTMHDLINDLAKFVSREFCFRLDDSDSFNNVSSKTRHFSYTQNSPFLEGLGVGVHATAKEEISGFDKFEALCEAKYLRTFLAIKPGPLWNIFSFNKLPINLGRLINLRHLDVRSTNLKEMPPHMDKLKDLHTLSDFVVGKQTAPSIVVLKELQIVGTLAISGLHNIVNSEDAFVANMRNKHLDGLALTWGAETDDSQKDREVLNNLQPHTHLKALSLKFYGGTRFPDWLGDHSFSNLVSLQLEDCKHCCALPPLGQLPSLVTLYVCGLNEVETIGPEFYGNGVSVVMPFRSLSVLFFKDMLGWQEWSHFGSSQEGGAFPHLCQLYLTNCPKLTQKLPEYLPSLTTLEIRRCEQLLGSLPRTRAILEIPSVKDNLCLEEKTSGTNSSLTPFPCDGLADALRVLKIKNCWNLSPLNYCYAFLKTLKIKSSCDSTTSIPLDYFPNVKELKLYDCRNLESLTYSQDSESPTILSLSSLRIFNCPNFISFPDGGLYAPNLIVLNISECDKLRSLPEHMCTSLSSLQAVILEYCSELESFPEGGLPSNLDMLRIFGSKKLIANRMHWGLDRLICLRYLAFSFDECEDVVSFPEEGLLPTILTTLCIFNSPNLKILDSKGFQNLTALQHLFIDGCNELECLPEGLPTSLSHLDINKCPLLTQRCQNEIGEDWPKISHITRVTVDGLDFIN
ncbi:hypothetical protein ACFX1W_039990 [Malus domestica]